jgi:hypothetical protein
VLVLVESKQITVGEVGIPMYDSTTALRQLLRSEGNEAHVVRISPKGYTLVNGVDYCYVGLKAKDGTDYSVQAYGKEAIELYEQAVKLHY